MTSDSQFYADLRNEGRHDPLPENMRELPWRLAEARQQVSGVLFGQDEIINLTLTALLAGGHALLVGVPGLGKTKLVETLGQVLGLGMRRVQCTPDLMPTDILGSEVLEESETGQRSFRFLPGPVFCQLLMADEINRASPRTQSALLQAMQERRVSIAGYDHPLPEPFYVLATQNPLEHEGTYPLPEAQLDRFLLQANIEYPGREAERQMVLATTGADPQTVTAQLTPEQLHSACALVRQLPIGEQVLETILDLVRRGRPESSDLTAIQQQVSWGPGPRASQAMMLATRARALIDGRLTPSLDDVVALAKPVLRHRMALTFAARAEGITTEQVIEQLCASCRLL